MYLDNNWYGDRYILSQYCRTKDKPAFASIQHGHMTIKNYKNNLPYGKRTISATPWLVWNQKIANYSFSKGIRNIIPIGAVFLYLEKILVLKKIKKKGGTLIFPFLSHPEERIRNDYDEIVEYLKKNYKPPYVISISKYDFKRQKKKYKNVSFVSFGFRGDKNYLKKLYIELNKNLNVICVYPGSPLLYSLYLKKKVFLTKSYFLQNLNNKRKKELDETRKTVLNDLAKYGLDINNLNKDSNKDKIKNMMGNKFLKSPSELKNILGWDSVFKISMANFFSKIINLKENLKHGLHYSLLAREGKNYSKKEYFKNNT